MNKYFKESVLWLFVALPYVYLITIWDKLPERVPIHFDLNGDPNGWSGKTMLLFIPAGLGIGIYLLMLLIPVIDPKKKIQEMGGKYNSLRFILTIFFSLIAIYTLYVSSAGSLKNLNMLLALIGFLYALLGNYFQALRPNYFIGIRSPWTLESEQVWKKTHLLGGRLWMSGGVLIVLFAFIIKNNHTFFIIFLVITSLLVAIPLIYSYLEFQKEKKENKE